MTELERVIVMLSEQGVLLLSGKPEELTGRASDELPPAG
jgi:hypothetical protein